MRWPVIFLPMLSACIPTVDDAPWLIESTRVLAIRGNPAEAVPDAAISLEALVASPGLEPNTSQGVWSFCTAPRAAAEAQTVSSRCLPEDSESLLAITSSIARLPSEACALFGPIAPPSAADEAPRRPADPDPTGGYYQPIRFGFEDQISFGFERLLCPAAQAPAEIAAQLQETYVPNQHPVIAAVELSIGGSFESARELGAVPPGTEARLRVRWAPGSAESFPVFDLDTRSVVQQTEGLSVAWFTTQGELQLARTGFAEDQVLEEEGTENSWVAPDETSQAQLWVVLSDSRGGSSWESFSVSVR